MLFFTFGHFFFELGWLQMYYIALKPAVKPQAKYLVSVAESEN